jgi:hypothetical protein
LEIGTEEAEHVSNGCSKGEASHAHHGSICNCTSTDSTSADMARLDTIEKLHQVRCCGSERQPSHLDEAHRVFPIIVVIQTCVSRGS